MANNIQLANRFLPIIDDIYKATSVTNGMDSAVRLDFTGVNEVRVLQVESTGLGDYSRQNGYPKGDVTAKWVTHTLTEERGKELNVDRMDDEETLGLTFGTVTGHFMRDHVIPELDAYRFAKYAGMPGTFAATPGALTVDSIIPAIDEAYRAMTEAEVPESGRRLYVNSNLLPIMNQALKRTWGSDSAVNTILSGYNGMPITYVPPARFYTKIELADGSTNWGYSKAADGKDINFMMIDPQAILQVVKFSLPKIFDPDTNQKMDAWLFQFREYHDAFVFHNKVKGVYSHAKA